MTPDQRVALILAGLSLATLGYALICWVASDAWGEFCTWLEDRRLTPEDRAVNAEIIATLRRIHAEIDQEEGDWERFLGSVPSVGAPLGRVTPLPLPLRVVPVQRESGE